MSKKKMFFVFDPGSDTAAVQCQPGQNAAIKDMLGRVREFVKTHDIIIVPPAWRASSKQIDTDLMISIAPPMDDPMQPCHLTILKNRNQLHQKEKIMSKKKSKKSKATKPVMHDVVDLETHVSEPGIAMAAKHRPTSSSSITPSGKFSQEMLSLAMRLIHDRPTTETRLDKSVPDWRSLCANVGVECAYSTPSYKFTEGKIMSKKQQTKQATNHADTIEAYLRKSARNTIVGAFPRANVPDGPLYSASMHAKVASVAGVPRRADVALSPDVIPVKELYGSGVEVYGNEGIVSIEGLRKALPTGCPLMVYEWLYVTQPSDAADRGRARAIESIYHIRTVAATGPFRAVTGTVTNTGKLIVFDEYISKITEQEGSCIVSVTARLMCDVRTVSQYFEFTFEVMGTDTGRFHQFRTATCDPTPELLTYLDAADILPVVEFKPHQENTMENKTTSPDCNYDLKPETTKERFFTGEQMRNRASLEKPIYVWSSVTELHAGDPLSHQRRRLKIAIYNAEARITKIFGVGISIYAASLDQFLENTGAVLHTLDVLDNVKTRLVVKPLPGIPGFEVYVEHLIVKSTRGTHGRQPLAEIKRMTHHDHDELDTHLVREGLGPWMPAGYERTVEALLAGEYKFPHYANVTLNRKPADVSAQTSISFDIKNGTVTRNYAESTVNDGGLIDSTSLEVTPRVSDSFVLEVVLEKLRYGHEVTADTVQQLMRDVRERVAKPGSEKINVVFVAKSN